MFLLFKISVKTWQSLTVLLAAVILVLAVFTGMTKGGSLAQAKLVAQNAYELAKGMEFFYNDNNRYPTALEYQDTTLILNYFNYFPPKEIVSSGCEESFIYKRISNSNFLLNFCFPQSIGSYKKGWNQIQGDY